MNVYYFLSRLRYCGGLNRVNDLVVGFQRGELPQPN